MILFIVRTNTQALNAFVLASSIFKNEKCDVYYSNELENFFSNAIVKSIFNNSYSINIIDKIEEKGIKGDILKIFNYLNNKRVFNALPTDASKYTKVFLSGVGIRTYGYYYAIQKKNCHIELNLYEEGINEYYYMGHEHYKEKISSILLFGRYYLDDVKNVYVYDPRVIQNVYKNIIVKEIPKLSKNSSLLNSLSNIFSYDKNKIHFNEKKVVFLEQKFDISSEYEQKLDDLQNCILHMLVEKFGKGNVWVKLHPRSEKCKYGEDYCYYEFQGPFEIVFGNEECENMLFVSMCSSTVLNFKLWYDIEPYIITLNKLMCLDSGVNELFNNVKDMCESNKFFIPDDIGEFEEIINFIYNKRKVNRE